MGRQRYICLIWMVVVFSFCWLPVESPAGLVAHWAFDEGSGTTAHDSTGSYPGTLAGSTAWSPVGGKAGGAVSLSRATGDYVTMGNVLPLTGTDFSLVVWVKTTAGDNVILSKHQSTVVAGYIMAQYETGSYGSPGKAWFYGRGEPSLAPISSTTINDGNWHQIIVTYAQGGNASIYVDGAPVEDFHPSVPIVDNAAPFLIAGLSTPSLTPEANFDGLIDDVQVYSQALMPEDVQWLFDHPGQVLVCAPPPSGLVSWWRAEGNATDFIGINNGTLVNNTSFASGRVGQAFTFDEVGDYVTVPDHPSLNPTAAITVDSWIFSNNSSLAPAIVKKASATSGYALELSVDSSQALFWVNLGSGGSGGWISSPAGGLTQGIWTHVAGVYDGTSVSLYINGLLIGSTPAPGAIVPSANDLNIGRDPSNSARFFNGLIDEAAIFNRALSAQEIATIYNAGSAGQCPVQYFVTANATGNGAGMVQSDVGGLNYDYPGAITGTTTAINSGANVVLKATASTESKATWTACTGAATGNGTALATCTYTGLDGNKTAAASFTLNPYSLTVIPSGTGSGSVTGNGIECSWDENNSSGTCSVNLSYNTAVSLTAAPRTGSIFSGWSGGIGSAKGCSGKGTCAFNMTEVSGIGSIFTQKSSIYLPLILRP